MSHRVFTFGEALLRLSVPPGIRLENAQQFDISSAGSEANVSAALAQIGIDVAWYSILPSSALGKRLAADLIRYGVDLSPVKWTSDGRLGTYFVELSHPPRPVSIIYDRAASTASRMSTDEFPWDLIDSASLVHVSGITPAISASCRELTLEVANRISPLDTRFSLDVNYRSKLWSPADAESSLTTLAGKLDLLIVSREDARDVFELSGEIDDVLDGLQERFEVQNIVLSLGANGSVWRSGEQTEVVPARSATVVDRIGAGDAFAAGVIAGYLEDTLGEGVRLGTVMAALALGINGDFLMTTREEVLGILKRDGRSVDR